MTEWISLRRRVTSTASRAFTPGNSIEIPRISTTLSLSTTADCLSTQGTGMRWGEHGLAPPPAAQSRPDSVLAVGQGCGGSCLVELAVGRRVGLVHGLTRDHVLHD